MIFRNARSQNKWQDKPVSEVTLRAVYDLLRWGPTSANCSPARFLFVTTPAAKEKLAACVSATNAPKVLSAPVTAIIGYDTKFYDRIPELFPHNPGARDWFAGNAALATETAFRNSSLQGAYLIIAARSLGLDCGPMSGFDADKVNEAFFADGQIKANFICGLGYGDSAGVFPRLPRLSFTDACSIA
nr:malonic semialdehyde reductase [Govania unica]